MQLFIRNFASGKDRLTARSYGAAKAFEFLLRKRRVAGRFKAPLLKKKEQPGGIIEPVRALAVGVPFFAVNQVHPRSSLPVALFPEALGTQSHGNPQKLFDSLQPIGYSSNEYRSKRSLHASEGKPGECVLQN